MIFLVLAQVEILDLAGPLQALSEANRSRRRYGIQLVSTRSRVESSQGLWLDSLEPLPAIPEDALIVVPGIRRPDDAAGDQLRTASPETAVAAGASHLVVGRPILESPTPEEVLRSMLEVMQ